MDVNRFPIDKEELVNLYVHRHRSVSEISRDLQISSHRIYYWMDKFSIKRRDRSTANYLKYNPQGDPFCVKRKLTFEEENLKNLALGLYWGEGNKTNKYAVRVTNADPGVIIVFRYFLDKICQLKDSKVKYDLQTFKDMDTNNARKYWSAKLGIGIDKISTSKPLASLGKGTYKRVSRYGVMSIACYNLKLKRYIIEELKELGSVLD